MMHTGLEQTEGTVVDGHIHLIGTGDSGSGCRVPKAYRWSRAYSEMLGMLGLSVHEATDDRIAEAVIDTLDHAFHIRAGVILALDGIHKNGRMVDSEDICLVPNEYVLKVVKKSRRAKFGASVHPYRNASSLMHEVRRCIDDGAALFHWSPFEQQIDPGDDRCIPFYLALIREGVPLLCHIRPGRPPRELEHYGDLRRLTKGLSIGLKLILALTPVAEGRFDRKAEERCQAELLSMLTRAEAMKWELYVDLSACGHPARTDFIRRMKQEISAGTIGKHRIIFGSDFPSAVSTVDDDDVCRIEEGSSALLRKHTNVLDWGYRVIRSYNLSEAVFTNAASVLRMGTS